MTLGERIKKVRKELDLTQQKFAEQIGTTQNNIASYEIGRREPSAAAVNNICKTFNVNETWLRTGEGEMFVEAPSDTLDALAREYHLDRFGRAVVEKMLNLNEKQWAAFHDFAMDVLEALPDDSAAPAPAPAEQGGASPDIAAKVAELERQNQELAAKVAAMEEEDALFGLTDAFSASPSESAGSSRAVEQAKK